MTLQQLTESINYSGLGPTRGVQILHPNGTEVIHIELDPTHPNKTRALQRWLDLIIFRDMTIGKYRATDPELRLNVRGEFPSGVPIIVTVAYHEHTESEQVRLITASIEEQRPKVLADQLTALTDTTITP
jgi:hypothetical protein